MSKYIIDTDQFEKLFETKAVAVLGIGDNPAVPEEGEKTVWTRMLNVADLEELNSDYINEHFGDLQDTAYKKGLAEGREQMPCDTCAYRHNKLLCADCKWTYGSCYKVDSIGAGDVVKTYNGITFVVTKATTDGIVVGFEGEGNTCRFALSEVTKTGEHYNINEILGGLCDD